MKPHTLKEFAENLRITGDWRETEFATEILDLLDIETEVAEPYSDLCCDIENYAKNFSNPDDASKALEWIGDRSNLLTEIEDQLKEAKRDGDVDDIVKEMIGTLADAEAILEAAGWPGMDFIDALQGLADRAARAPEETEIVTYDL